MSFISFQPIGFFKGDTKERYLLPRQGALASKKGTIELLPQQNFETALLDLYGFGHIWVIYCFHRSLQHWRPKVQPPRGSSKRGVFATRSPHRPNPIGLSAVKLLSVKGRLLEIQDHDLIDGTPILDIKPYITYADSHPLSRQGWLEDLPKEEPFTVLWRPQAKVEALWIDPLFAAAVADLLKDPLPRPARRIRWFLSEISCLELSFKSWRVYFCINEEMLEVKVLAVESGYPEEELLPSVIADSPDEEKQRHRTFNALFQKTSSQSLRQKLMCGYDDPSLPESL
ncbi:MAG: rcsF [Chlamydiales bacterium]|jgi:tRNA-Thr(GGU) m(6)t(6)A37 methyltransferase TsaA|nr:rcsF [Chlamydiales bacterium]